jgi:hypothetical protein
MRRVRDEHQRQREAAERELGLIRKVDPTLQILDVRSKLGLMQESSAGVCKPWPEVFGASSGRGWHANNSSKKIALSRRALRRPLHPRPRALRLRPSPGYRSRHCSRHRCSPTSWAWAAARRPPGR